MFNFVVRACVNSFLEQCNRNSSLDWLIDWLHFRIVICSVDRLLDLGHEFSVLYSGLSAVFLVRVQCLIEYLVCKLHNFYSENFRRLVKKGWWRLYLVYFIVISRSIVWLIKAYLHPESFLLNFLQFSIRCWFFQIFFLVTEFRMNNLADRMERHRKVWAMQPEEKCRMWAGPCTQLTWTTSRRAVDIPAANRSTTLSVLHPWFWLQRRLTRSPHPVYPGTPTVISAPFKSSPHRVTLLFQKSSHFIWPTPVSWRILSIQTVQDCIE